MKASRFVKALAIGVMLSGCAFAGEQSETKPTAESAAAKPPPVAAKPTPVAAKPPLVLESDADKVSYAIGMQIAQTFKSQGIEVNREVLFRAIEDVLTGREPSLSEADARQVMGDYQKRMAEVQRERMRQEGARNRAEGKAFLDENKTKPGVVVLPSGLQYRVLQEGTGRTPTGTDRVKAHYRGTLINGQEFDSSYSRGAPAEFGVTQVIKGWTEALQLMKEGAKWQLFVPAGLAYGPSGRPPTIPPSSVLIFEVELLEVVVPAQGE